jgi:hypothetical protein
MSLPPSRAAGNTLDRETIVGVASVQVTIVDGFLPLVAARVV